jgi:enamine deaminase RidA (YjgF/YER057c/UK114 family)
MSAKIDIYNPEELGQPLGLYKHITRVRASEFLFIAGQLSVNREGTIIGIGDLEAQMVQVFSNLRAALQSADADFANIVKFTTYLKHAEDIEEFMRVREKLFADFFPDGNCPPNTLLVVNRLVHDAFLVEVETTAAV